uniref:Protein phosphatase 1 regulatory subunit 12a n=1 Tax=Corethrella appendiculata TaxID=1370023 RepID=U5EYV8_9DIPT
MALDTRNNSALFKRAEQLKRWEEAEANRPTSKPRNPNDTKIKFSSGCIFLAACIAGDKDEVSRLLEQGADINTANVDGLTALHQACIDDNLDMVEFLVQKGADVNRKDNEGWTPLHATSSCGFLSIARYLIENGADLASINSDGELALDITSSDSMEDLIRQHVDEQGIDCDEARQIEEKMMLNDAKKWLRNESTDVEKPHPKTGATALHVAAAKGYMKVLNLLLDSNSHFDIDKQDFDGWTALHAAAYWGQVEGTQLLLNSNADVDIQNYSGQTAIDIAQKDLIPMLEEARKNNKRIKRRPASQISNRITDSLESNIETPPKVIRVEVKPIETKEKDKEIIKPQSDSIVPKTKENNLVENEMPWRRTGSLKSRTQQESPPKIQVPEKENQPTEPEVILRRTQSFESDEKFYKKYQELRARIKANSCPILPAPLVGAINNNNNNNNITTTTNTNTTNTTTTKQGTNNFIVQRSASLKDHRLLRKTTSNLTSTTPTITTTQTSSSTTISSSSSPPTSPTSTQSSTPSFTSQIRRSFVPPTRDEESETQRKAHAKRVRETRRSTQGVTLDEIKSAEQFVRKKYSESGDTETADVTTTNPSTQSTTTTTTTIQMPSTLNDRIPKINDDTNEHITATYTIPSSVISGNKTNKFSSINDNSDKKDVNDGDTGEGDDGGGGGGGDVKDKDEIKVSASYTITPNLTTTLNATIPSSTSISKEHENNENESDVKVSATIMTTFNVPSTNSNNNNNSSNNNLNKTELITTTPSLNNNNESTTITPTTKTSAASNVFTKRSLFDIDNANSLTLAEKLRQEANKYAENQDITTSSITKYEAQTPTPPSSNDTTATVLLRKDSTSSNPSSPLHQTSSSLSERRPSWRLKVDAGSKFKLENASATTNSSNNNNNQPSNDVSVTINKSASSLAQRRQQQQQQNTTSNGSGNTPSTRLITSSQDTQYNDRISNNEVTTPTTEVTIPLRRLKNNNEENKENTDNSGENRNSAQATQAVIQRRRRPKRRSTGVVHVDMEDIDPERQDSPVDGDDKESGSELSRSRLGSTNSLAVGDSSDNKVNASENGGDFIDYKALYEAAKADNDKLKSNLKKKDDELLNLKAALERFTNATTKNSLTELEKREKRAMERKISEMEEELKQLDTLKTENQRLKDENGALIRVISKLSR